MGTLRRQVERLRQQAGALAGQRRRTAWEDRQLALSGRLQALLEWLQTHEDSEACPPELSDLAYIWPVRDVLASLLADQATEAGRQAALLDDRKQEAAHRLTILIAAMQLSPEEQAAFLADVDRAEAIYAATKAASTGIT